MRLRWLPPALLERRVLIALIVIAAGAWAFLALADEVREGETVPLDRAIMLLFRDPADPSRPLGPPGMDSAVRDITALGGWVVISLVTFGVVGRLLLAGRRRQAVLVLVAIVGAAFLVESIKDIVERPRPDLVPHGVVTYTHSFPSGHATGGAATYLTLGALLARFEPRRRLKVFALSVAVVITLLIGLSRIYLGVHWPSDVLAGWTLGACWALLCWSMARILQRSGAVETGASRAEIATGS